VAIHRFRSTGTVLVGREPDDPSAVTTAADLLAYVVRLGRRAGELARADPPLTPQRVVETLRAVKATSGVPVLADARLPQLAAEASDTADLNALGQLYPVGMPAVRALKLAEGILTRRSLEPEQVRQLVRARFPNAEPLPRRPVLDDLLQQAGTPLHWDPPSGRYVPSSLPGSVTSSRMVTSTGPLVGPEVASEVDGKLAAVIERGGFLALLAPPRLLGPARRALLGRLSPVEVDVTAILLERLRDLDYPWQDILDADTGDPHDPNFRALTDLVRHDVVPAVRRALEVAEPVLITEAAPLARYGQVGVLRELADISVPRPAARLLLVPARRPEPAMLDSEPLPLTSPATQALWLPEAWVSSHVGAGR
jgi:hypothetical protein